VIAAETSCARREKAAEHCCNAAGYCCQTECCDGVCCDQGETCCNGVCWPNECCNGVPCQAGETCCGDIECRPPEGCCNNLPCDGVCCNGVCCQVGETCCGGECCPTGIVGNASSSGPRVCCADVCCAEGLICCAGQVCCEPINCCDGTTCCSPGQICCDGVCAWGSCSLAVQPATGCPGSSVELSVMGACSPDCDAMTFSMQSSVQYLTVNLPATMPCAGSPHQQPFTVDIDPEAPVGPIQFELFGASSAAGCSTVVTVTVEPDVNLISLVPGATLVLGNDLTISYEVISSTGAGFDQVDLEIRNSSDTLVFALPGQAGAQGNHALVWPEGKWNQAPHAGAFANPTNGPYEVKLIGKKTGCSDREVTDSVNTKLEIEADVKDDIPSGATPARSAGLQDMLDALKIVVKLGTTETVFTGAGTITVTGANPHDRHIKIDASSLNALPDGLYEALFRDLRDEIGNFSDADGVPSNGIQPIMFNLELR